MILIFCPTKPHESFPSKSNFLKAFIAANAFYNGLTWREIIGAQTTKETLALDAEKCKSISGLVPTSASLETSKYLNKTRFLYVRAKSFWLALPRWENPCRATSWTLRV